MSTTTRSDRRDLGARDWIALAVFLLVSFAAGLVAARTRGDDAASYYGSLPLPSFAPDADLFGPVWIAMYVLLGVSAWLVWRRWGWSGSGGALNLWLLQLVLTAAWTPVFFGMHDVLLGLIVLVLLLLAAIATMTAFWRRSQAAAWLLLPYVFWVAFLTLVNGAIWWNQS